MKALKNLFPFFLLLLLFSCNKTIEVDVNLEREFDNSMFRGLTPDISYKEMCERVGKPNDYIDEKHYNEDDDHNPVYYFKEGKVMAYWSGNKRDPIGNLVYTPYLNTEIDIHDILKVFWFNHNNIKANTKKIKLIDTFNYNPYVYIITLDNFKVKKIWMGTKK